MSPPTEAPRIERTVAAPSDDAALFDKIAEELLHEDRDVFDGLTPHEQSIVLEYLSTAVVDNRVENAVHDLLWELDFHRKPVDIHTFLTDDYFLGRACSDLHPKWMEDIEAVFATGSPVFEWVMTGAIGIGKGIDINDSVLTPTGWRRAGDIRVGDYFIGRDGYPTMVTHVFPRGVLRKYRVTFNDGACVEVDADHLWEVQTPSSKMRGHASRVYSTRELMDRGVTNGRGQRKWHVPVVAPVHFAPRTLPLDPYALGALLGDGGLTGTSVRLSSEDLSLVDEVSCRLGLEARYTGHGCDYRLVYGVRGENPVLTELRRLGVCHLAHEKRVPQEYLFGSVADRLMLLRGLMDTDGWVQNNGKSALFCTTSLGLALDVIHLVRSLGGIARKSEKPTDGRLAYNVDINLPVNPFMLPRKANAWKPHEKYTPARMIDSIVPVGEGEIVCFKVDAADELFVVRDFIVTHNTTLACAAEAYKIYYLSCLKDPAKYYGLLPDSLIVFGIYSITKRQVADAGYFKLRGYIDSSPYFRKEYPRSTKIDSKIVFTKQNVQVIPGSQELHALGLDLFAFMMDEVNFMRAKNDKETGRAMGQAYDLYNATHTRLMSRFMRPGGTLPGLMLLLSSRNAQTSFLEEHLKKRRRTKETFVSDYPLWEVKPKHRFTLPKITVEIGDRVSASRIVPDGESPRQGARTIEVPGEFRRNFQEDIDQALRDVAGVATFNLSPLIRDRQSVFDAYRDHLRHPFTRESLTIGLDLEGDDLRVDSYFQVEEVCRIQSSKWVPRLNPAAPRFMHVDIGLTGDALGMGMSHVAGIIENERTNPDGTSSIVPNPYIVVDLMLRVVAPVGSEVDLGKIRGFIAFLAKLFPLQKVTFDGFQSADCIQILKKVFHNSKTEVGKQSVDRTDEAYLSLRSGLFDRRIAMYQYGPYEREVLDLERDVKKRKVDHPLKATDGGKGSKDVTDGVAGSVWLCMNDPRATSRAPAIENFDTEVLKPALRQPTDEPEDRSSIRRIAGRRVDWSKLRRNV